MSEQIIEATTSPAQIVQQAAVDYLNTSNAPGCCIAVYDAKSFGTKGYVYPKGLSAVAGSSPAPFNVTTDTVFEIGSVTKVFTSTLLAVAVKAGGPSLDDTIGTYLNPFSPNGVGTPVLDAIQLVQFATHTSGMPEQPGGGLTGYSEQLFADEPPSSELIAWWDKYNTPPSGYWQYSNIGFVTLGFAVTQMYGKDPGHNYNEILADYITDPLGMKQTGAVVDPSWKVAQGCIGHWSKSTEPPYQIIFDRNTPTGGTAFDLKSTGDDMLKFLAAQIAPKGQLGLAIALTQQPQGTFPVYGASNTVTMGLGWQITKDTQGNAVFTKNGATSKGGFEAIVIVVPQLQCGVAVLSNQYFNSSGVHPAGIGPGSAAQKIISQLHPGFELTEPLAEHDPFD
ncbi:beta-lactamase family protein [Bradyrhizobium tropiciagri]|uniref:serine hydrolase domain-containing protein n=1 Tax=Bradyrhizobium tropiciagri TaxID=312253 RepID=UPI001BA85546|nr:serine hydrolase domain-containing protein [Bradyrhizobium tropiciagri]MBR0895680.1 beta-lactamase family protein [Bradyrhizobium tropiciagri]